MYPMIADPPLFGAVQLRLICEEEAGVAVSPVGADGATARVVADAVLAGGLVPVGLTLDTLYGYVVPGGRPVSLYVVAELTVFDTIVLRVGLQLVVHLTL